MTPEERAELAILQWSLSQGLGVILFPKGTEKSLVPFVADAIHAAVQAEREIIIQLVVDEKEHWYGNDQPDGLIVCQNIYQAIRARTAQDEGK